MFFSILFWGVRLWCNKPEGLSMRRYLRQYFGNKHSQQWFTAKNFESNIA